MADSYISHLAPVKKKSRSLAAFSRIASVQGRVF
jgi:hypothetical protein